MYQNPEQMFIKDSIRKDIEFAMKTRNIESFETRTNELLEMFQLTDLAERDGRLLSGGQMRRASLAIGIALRPQILLLDEPTANLDIATRKEIMKTLITLKDVTETVVIATHDMQLVCDWATRILADNILDKISIEYLRNQVLKNAYGNDDTRIAKLDPRVLLMWYLFFGVVPWFLKDVILLFGIFSFVILTTRAAKIAPLVLFLFGIGVFSQSGYLLLISLFFGGDISTVLPLLILTLKVAIVSLASITVFSGLDPDRLATGLLWFGCPDQLSLSISYAYRILPMLMEEFQNILVSYKFRGLAPSKDTLLGKIKYFIYQIKIIMLSFYPLMLNTAKKSRTTVEALEIKGYRYAMKNPAVKKMKLAMLKIGKQDVGFVLISMGCLGISIFLVRSFILDSYRK